MNSLSAVRAPKHAREARELPRSFAYRFSACGKMRPYSEVLPRISK